MNESQENNFLNPIFIVFNFYSIEDYLEDKVSLGTVHKLCTSFNRKVGIELLSIQYRIYCTIFFKSIACDLIGIMNNQFP